MSNLDALRLMVHFLQDSDLGVSAGIDDDARARAKNVLEWGVDEIARLRAEVLHLRAAATLSEAEDDAMGEAIRMGDRWGWSETLRSLRERLSGGKY